jgi:hypothetical protein
LLLIVLFRLRVQENVLFGHGVFFGHAVVFLFQQLFLVTYDLGHRSSSRSISNTS